MGSCKYCGREINNQGSLVSHEQTCKENPNRIIRNRSPNAGVKKGSIPWNKGKTVEEYPQLSKECNIGKRFGASLNGHTEETKRKLSEYAKSKNLGGYVEGSGRGKRGRYKGLFCDSSWELAYVIYCMDHNIKIVRNTEKFAYQFNGGLKHYIPDFIVDGKYVEVKGYWTEQWQSKLDQFPHDIIVLDKDAIQPYLKYVHELYGKDFVNMYE